MRAAILSLVVATALVASARMVDAAPPRFSGNHHVPVQTLSSFDQARYGEPLPYSARGSAFYDYGVAYPAPAYRNYPNVTPVRPLFPGVPNIGTYGTFREWRQGRR